LLNPKTVRVEEFVAGDEDAGDQGAVAGSTTSSLTSIAIEGGE
jgi:hypothetical protein